MKEKRQSGDLLNKKRNLVSGKSRNSSNGPEGNSINTVTFLTLSNMNFYRQSSVNVGGTVTNADGTDMKWFANNEQQGYSNENNNTYSRINANGSIEIDLKKNSKYQNDQSKPVFVSSRLITIDEYNSLKMEPNTQLDIDFMATLPVPKDANGNKLDNFPIWPALWIMGRNVVGNIGTTETGETNSGGVVGWPYCSEIDVMEWNGRNNNYSTAFHYYDNTINSHFYESGGNRTLTINELENEHSFKVRITNTDSARWIEFFFDNLPIGEHKNLSDPKYDEFFYDQRPGKTQQDGKYYSLLMNIAYGGVFVGGAPNASTDYSNFGSARMTVSAINTTKRTGGDILEPGTGPGVDAGFIMTGVFDGTEFIDTDVYNFPTGAKSYAGFANLNPDMYPIEIPNDESWSITFDANPASADNAPVDVFFKLETNPYSGSVESTLPSYTTDTVTVDSEGSYIIA